MFCQNCGKENPEGSVFCAGCGIEIAKSNNPQKEKSSIKKIFTKTENAETKPKQELKTLTIKKHVFFPVVITVGVLLVAATTFLIITIINLSKENNDFSKKIDLLEVLEKEKSTTINRNEIQIRELKNSIDELRKYETILNSPDMNVIITKVYNYADGSTDLNHSKITWLSFDYTVVKKTQGISNSEKLYVKYISPYGGIMRNDSISPLGYTFSMPLNIGSSGWGNNYAGSTYYNGGWYTIEIYYKDRLVGMKKFYVS